MHFKKYFIYYVKIEKYFLVTGPSVLMCLVKMKWMENAE